MAKRVEIPKDVAAQVQFLSDRTCCVCVTPEKPIQIHHLDEDPSNNDPANLAVLCLDCHNETQIKGGFGRKLDAEQITLYRASWHQQVAARRGQEVADAREAHVATAEVAKKTNEVAEVYREHAEWGLLADFYNSIGSVQLRDKYIEKELAEADSTDQNLIHMRAMQGRPDLVPREVIEREVARREETQDWAQQARMYRDLERPVEAVRDYTRFLYEKICGLGPEDSIFSVAFYLRELSESGLHNELYELALIQAKERGDLWWQARALQDLGDSDRYEDWLRENLEAVRAEGHLELMRDLARATGDNAEAEELDQVLLSGIRTGVMTEDGPRLRERSSAAEPESGPEDPEAHSS